MDDKETIPISSKFVKVRRPTTCDTCCNKYKKGTEMFRAIYEYVPENKRYRSFICTTCWNIIKDHWDDLELGEGYEECQLTEIAKEKGLEDVHALRDWLFMKFPPKIFKATEDDVPRNI